MKNEDLKPGNKVKFYDCYQAQLIDRDYSGSDPKHYPIGLVVDVYDHIMTLEDRLFTDKVCDILINGRISKGHFVDGVEIIN